MTNGMGSVLTEADLMVRENPAQELLAVLLDHAPDSWAFHDIRSDASNFHGPTRLVFAFRLAFTLDRALCNHFSLKSLPAGRSLEPAFVLTPFVRPPDFG